MVVYKDDDYLSFLENIENKSVHNYINELGAQLNNFEREDARIILNDLILSGRDDYWICIALIRILGKGNFSQWKYLLKYDPFIEETDIIYNLCKKTRVEKKLKELDFYSGYIGDEMFKGLSDEDNTNLEILADMAISDDKISNYETFREIVDYYFFRFYLNANVIKRYLEDIKYNNKNYKSFDFLHQLIRADELFKLQDDKWWLFITYPY